MWVSTVRSPLSALAPQTASSSASREWMRCGAASSFSSRPSSSLVRFNSCPSSRTRAPSTAKPATAAGTAWARRSNARTRATSSRGLKGLAR